VRRRAGQLAAVLACLSLALTSCTSTDGTDGRSSRSPDGVDLGVPDAASLRFVARFADGDSFTDTFGIEYRVGLVNTPEVGECGSKESSRATKDLLAEGFAADVYAVDTHERSVARIVTSTGVDLGVHLARQGLADDRYMDNFRGENEGYASELDEAFGVARAEKAGLWSSCWAARP
jgi:endonuclease YncB( thermonuclease family)